MHDYPTENNLGQFVVTTSTLEDGSTVHGVDYRTPYGTEVVAEPASQKCADELALALEHVRRAYLDCGSDVAVSLLSIKLIRALDGD
jgi:hypothetical protein